MQSPREAAIDTDLLRLCAGVAVVVILGAVVFGVLQRLAPGRELTGVDAAPGVWTALSFRVPRGRAYRLWACVSIDGGERTQVAAQVEARTSAGTLQPPAAVEVGRRHWYAAASHFHVLLWGLPRLDAGTVVNLRVRVIGIDGTSLKAARVYVAT